MGRRTVVVTGIGVIAPNGIGQENFWEALIDGRSGIKKISFFDSTPFPTQIAGEVREFNPADYMEGRKARRLARSSQFAVAASRMALEDANLSDGLKGLSLTGVIIGININAVEIIEGEYKVLLSAGVKRMNPFSAGACSSYAPASEVASEFECKGFSLTVSAGCTSGLIAIGRGFREIKQGKANLVICGGVDTPITPLSFGSFCASGIMSTQNYFPEMASRPFDAKRDGGVLAEGVGVVVLEDLDHALSRGARIYGEVIGYGEMGEGIDILKNDSDEEGFQKAMELALKEAEILPKDINYISAHGPSDPVADKLETLAIKRVFGEYAYRLPISSIKSMTGNPLAAAGPMQVIASLLTMESDIIPPTINYEFPDPDCDLDYVPNMPRRNKVGVVLVNSHGFGGSNACLIIQKFRK